MALTEAYLFAAETPADLADRYRVLRGWKRAAGGWTAPLRAGPLFVSDEHWAYARSAVHRLEWLLLRLGEVKDAGLVRRVWAAREALLERPR